MNTPTPTPRTKAATRFYEGLDRSNSFYYVDVDDMAEIELELAAERAECLEQARLNGMGAEREAVLLGGIEIMTRALKEIAQYDKGTTSGLPGICPYGCDTPYLAQLALYKTGHHHTDPESQS